MSVKLVVDNDGIAGATRYIVYIYLGGGELVAMRKTRKAAEDLLAEEGCVEGVRCKIRPIGPEEAWYNGVC